MPKRNKHAKDYEEQHQRYAEYVETLEDLIRKLLKKHKIRFQSVQGRAKAVDSFEKNLKVDKYKDKTIKQFSDIPDLAGCRVIFYLDADLRIFERVLHDEFENQHRKDIWSEKGYNAVHFIGTLKKKRADLPEYDQFKGLSFEIQLVTVLFHGWNELEHDPFYKDISKVEKHFPHKFANLKKIAEGIMEKYIRPAQNDWEYLTLQYDLTAKGIDISELDKIRELAKCDNNNEIYKQLEQLKDFTEKTGAIREEYEPKLLIPLFKEILKKAKTNKYEVDKTPFYTFKGKTSDDIAVLMLDFLSMTKYRGLEPYFDFLTELYPDQSKEVKQKINDLATKTATYRSEILKHNGLYVQATLTKIIKNWSKDKQTQLLDFICSMGEAILQPEFRDITSDYKDGKDGGITGTFSTVSLKPNDALKSIREDWVRLLMKLYPSLNQFQDQVRVIRALEHALQDSMYTQDFWPAIIESAKEIFKFYIDIVPKSSLEILLFLDEQMGRHELRFQSENMQEIEDFWTALKEQGEYQFYKVLVGYDVRFDRSMQWTDVQKYREDEIEKYIGQINEENEGDWVRRLINFAKTLESIEDIGMFNYFNRLLLKVGSKRPSLAFQLLENEETMASFFGPILEGLLMSDRKDEASKKVNDWIKARKHLSAVMLGLAETGGLNPSKAREVFDSIEQLKDEKDKKRLLIQLISYLSREEKINKKLVLEVAKELSKLKSYNWLLYVCDKDQLFESFDEKDWDRMLDNLVHMESLEGHAKRMLAYVVRKFPKKYVEFFGKRLSEENKKNEEGWRYSAIPHDLVHVDQALREKQEEIVNEVFKWFDKKGHGWKASLFLHSMYPGFCESINRRMEEIIEGGNRKAIDKYIFPMFSWYQGDVMIPLALRLVKKLPKDKKLWGSLFGYMSTPGMLSGNVNDPIFANAYRAKKERIKTWELEDEKTKEFAEEYARYLENNANYYEKEHEKEITALKKEYSKES